MSDSTMFSGRVCPEACLSAIVEHSVAAIVAVDVHGTIYTWNPAAERLFGFSAAEVRGRHMQLLVPEDRRREHDRRLRQLLSGDILRIDTVLLHRDGQRLDVHMRAGPVRDGSQAIIGMVASIIGTTEFNAVRRRADAAASRHAYLLELGDQLRRATEPREIQLLACRILAERLDVPRVYYGEYESDEDHLVIEQEYHSGLPSVAGRWRIEDFGIEVARRFRAGSTVVVNDAATDAMIEPAMRPAYAQLQIGACVGVPLVREGRLVMMLTALDSKARRWTAEEITLIEDTAERTWEAVERGRAEQRLRHSEDRLSSAMSIETVGVMFFKADGPICASNETFRRWSGFTQAEIETGRLSWQSLTPPEFFDASLNAIREFSTRGYTTPYEKQYFRKDGSRWWGLFAARRLPDGSGVEFIIDVTERRQLEDSLREADRRKDEFLATLGHELRNPLAPIRNGLQIVRVADRNDPLLDGTIDMMDRQVSHLVHLVNDLLDLGRISAGKIELRRSRVMLNDLVRTSIEASRVFIDAHRHELILDMPEQEIPLDADPERMVQVISNLLSNAAKYTDDGGRIEVRVTSHDHVAGVAVTDSGIGIAADDLDHVFDLFSQVRSHQNRSEGGLGVGLSLVKSLVTMHGGSVRVYSEGPGKGTTFTVEVPLAEEVAESARPVEAEQTREVAAGARNILVVDDNVDSANSLALLLGLEGHTVMTAFDGLDAVEKAAAAKPEVVLLDLGMPRLDGFEAARRIRALPGGQRMTLVALTGWGLDADRQRTQESGFDYHLVKPVDPQDLSALMRRFAAGMSGAQDQTATAG